MSVCDVPDPRSLPKRHVGRKDDPQSGILDLGFYGAQPLDQDGEASGIGFGGDCHRAWPGRCEPRPALWPKPAIPEPASIEAVFFGGKEFC